MRPTSDPCFGSIFAAEVRCRAAWRRGFLLPPRCGVKVPQYRGTKPMTCATPRASAARSKSMASLNLERVTLHSSVWPAAGLNPPQNLGELSSCSIESRRSPLLPRPSSALPPSPPPMLRRAAMPAVAPQREVTVAIRATSGRPGQAARPAAPAHAPRGAPANCARHEPDLLASTDPAATIATVS